MVKRIAVFICLMLVIAICSLAQNEVRASDPKNEIMIFDMVHHNPGEPRYESRYNDPAVIKEMGFNGKVYFLFDAPTIAINWESVDPDIFPKGSPGREWVDARAALIESQLADCKAAGIQTYAMADLVLLPKSLIKKYNMEKTFGDPKDPQTEKFLRAMIDQIFERFPNLDGLFVRIGETYLQDAPYHQGNINDKMDADKTIIPLAQLLREEISVKRNKNLIFRTWLSFDENLDTYLKVSNAIEPHSNLVFGVKHVEGDFHRTTPFSKVLGQGRHRQLVEVQCAREYEGKGAYPNYIARGVIEGFEEHADMPASQLNSIRDFYEQKPEMFAGIWTWTRGGGGDGPYIKDEIWTDVNAWVMAQWASNPAEKEEKILERYAVERLGLKGADVQAFKKLSYLSADAVIRGRNSTAGDMNVWWTRDQGIGWPVYQRDKDRKRNLAQKDESIAIWKQIVELAKSINWGNEATKEHAIGSSYYGLRLYEIYRIIIYLEEAEVRGDKADMKKWIEAYDHAWAVYNKLPEQYASIATLYTREFRRHIRNHAHSKVEKLRSELETTRQVVDSTMKLPASGIVELRLMRNFNNKGVIQRMSGQFVFASYGNRKNI